MLLIARNIFLPLHSKLAVFDGKKAIRGGIPFVFRKYLNQISTNSMSK